MKPRDSSRLLATMLPVVDALQVGPSGPVRPEQPELPRLVDHPLHVLNLLCDAWTPVPQPTLELGRESGALRLALYGEPYMH